MGFNLTSLTQLLTGKLIKMLSTA